jgi:pyruvate,water dikinase
MTSFLRTGTTASMGDLANGRAYRADLKNQGPFKDGDVLVHDMTTPDLILKMKKAVAIVTFKGGKTCHAAIVSRELGVPCIVGVTGGGEIQTGDMLSVDTSQREGRVYWTR